MLRSESQQKNRKSAKESKSKVDNWDDEDDEQWPLSFHSEQRKIDSMSRLREHTSIVPVVVTTTPATIAILNKGRWCKEGHKNHL